MSFYKKLKDEKDTDFSEEKALEEQYQKIFKKIARDFIHVEDFKEIIRDIISDLFADTTVNLDTRRNAYLKAKEYERNLNKKISERTQYLDIDFIDTYIKGKKDD